MRIRGRTGVVISRLEVHAHPCMVVVVAGVGLGWGVGVIGWVFGVGWHHNSLTSYTRIRCRSIQIGIPWQLRNNVRGCGCIWSGGRVWEWCVLVVEAVLVFEAKIVEMCIESGFLTLQTPSLPLHSSSHPHPSSILSLVRVPLKSGLKSILIILKSIVYGVLFQKISAAQ